MPYLTRARRFLTAIAAALSISAHAASQEEIDVACDLEKAKAEITASILESPYAYGSINNAPNDKAATAGIGYSLAGRSKAKAIREAADARCTAVAATLELDEQQRWTMLSISKAGAKAELVVLLEAKKRSDEQLLFIRSQLKAQTVTLAEFSGARQAQNAIDSRISQLKAILSEPSTLSASKTFRELLELAKSSTVRAAELEARAAAESAWDISAVIGGRKELGSGSPGSSSSGDIGRGTPFIGLTFRWSFGYSAANSAVRTVRERTERLFVISRAGYIQTADRLLSQVQDLLKIEREREAFVSSQVRETEQLLASFGSLDTALALNTKRSLELQHNIQQAELAGVKRRIAEYQAFISRI